MTKLPAIAIGAAAVALAAAATAAASPKTHKMDVALPGGSVAHIEYVGDVAPKVTVDPRPMADAAGAWGMPFPSFAAFDRMMADMQRQSAQMRAQITARQAAGAAPYIADFGNLPAGETSTTVVTVSNNGSTCTRTTETMSQGAGKPPKVTSSASGQCSNDAQPLARATHPA